MPLFSVRKVNSVTMVDITEVIPNGEMFVTSYIGTGSV